MTQPNQSTGGGWARSFSAFTRQNRYLRVILALALVLAVATSLWFATPTEAFDINFPTLPSSGTVNNSYLFTTQLCVATSELIPIQSVALYIYKADDRTNYQAYASLPINMASVTYSHAQTGGGIIGVNAIPGAVWLWGYGYGYADWQGQGYRFFPGPGGYGYGYSGYGGPTSMTYNIEWVSPAGWPVGTYKIEIRVLTTTGTTFIKTSSPFSLSAAAAPPQSPTPTQVEEMTTPAAAAAVEQMTTQQAATVLEQVSTDKAAEIIATVSTEKAADIVETVTTAKAAAIVDQVSTTTAATIMEQVIPTRAAEIIEQVDINKATGIVEQVTATTATAIVQEVETTKAAEIVEQVTITRAVSIVENVTTTKAAGIVEQVTTDKAACIIEQVTTA